METVSEFAAWTGRGRLDQLVGELERQKETKIDFVADTRSLAVSAKDGQMYLVPTEPHAMEWRAGPTVGDLKLLGDVRTIEDAGG